MTDFPYNCYELNKVKSDWAFDHEDLEQTFINKTQHHLWQYLFHSLSQRTIFGNPNSDAWLEELNSIIEKYERDKISQSKISNENQLYLQETIRLHFLYLSNAQEFGEKALDGDTITDLTTLVTDYFVNLKLPPVYSSNQDCEIKDTDIAHVFGSLWKVIEPQKGHRPDSFFDLIRLMFPRLKNRKNKSLSESIQNAYNKRPTILIEKRKPLSELLN
jgi:hypothetical protein